MQQSDGDTATVSDSKLRYEAGMLHKSLVPVLFASFKHKSMHADSTWKCATLEEATLQKLKKKKKREKAKLKLKRPN